MIVLALVATVLALALFADFIISKVSNLSQRMAPMMILLTFWQTLTLLVDVQLSWPATLRDLISALTIFNFNFTVSVASVARDRVAHGRKCLTS